MRIRSRWYLALTGALALCAVAANHERLVPATQANERSAGVLATAGVGQNVRGLDSLAPTAWSLLAAPVHASWESLLATR